MDTGYDVITLTTPGRKWYICGKAYGKHCMMGQKLFIYVKPKPYMPPKPPVGRHPIHHFVGDAFGWKFNFDYAAWARGRDFRVGDSLVFKYPRGYHNVYKVSGPEFNYCKVPQATEALTSGYDVIKLTSPGRKCFKYAVGKHDDFKVNGPDFMACIAPSESEEMATGNDVIKLSSLVFKYASDKVGGPECEHCSVPQEHEAMATRNDVVRLATPGKRWYVCGKAEASIVAPSNSLTWEAAPLTGPRKSLVGDDKGWTLNFNYTAWAEGKEFRLGEIQGIKLLTIFKDLI
ncbi:uncharacterized protein A4U43_C03F4600 [Asparagus officinalis]|uniref:Phytocyanin domain-containing protein n=1 Tax=Asparagus officinalis TaxID=4686 RepID=A0A5P1FA34_ASPOF|nr:uncharacterized protein A4U43_C03F4600 [Asparagus officinalis]